LLIVILGFGELRDEISLIVILDIVDIVDIADMVDGAVFSLTDIAVAFVICGLAYVPKADVC
jgi:hypothetical protein